MPIQTYVQDGALCGYLPATGHTVRVPLREIVQGARASFSAAELAELDSASGPTVGGVLDEVGAGKIAKKLKKAVKKVASSKIVKAMAKVVKKAVPPPFSLAVTAAAGAAKLGKALKSKSKATKAKAKSIVPAVRAAAAGKISSKQLTKIAKRKGVKPRIAQDAALIKRVANDARTNPKAAATLALANDLTSSEPAETQRGLSALARGGVHEPSTSRESRDGDYEEAPLAADLVEDEQASMTEDAYGPDEVQAYEVDQGEGAQVDDTEGADAAELDEAEDGYVSGYGYY